MSRAKELAMVGLVGLLGLAGCPGTAPCSPSDAVMAAHAAECAARVRVECVGISDEDCVAVKECDEWGNARCGVGASGAPAVAGSAGAK